MSPKDLFVLHLDRWPIYQQLQLEEALLRTDCRNWCLFNRGSPSAVVMGISGKAHELVNEPLLRGIPLIRRFSGGGCVLVDEETLFVSLICNQADVPILPFPQPILEWNGALYAPLFLDQPFQIRENDYAVGNRKWGGNAQYILKNRWLHHTTLLWDYCPKKMEVLKLPSKMPAYREKRAHHDFLCKLKSMFPSKEHIADGLLNTLSKSFNLIFTHPEEAKECLVKPHRKATVLIQGESAACNSHG